MAKTVISSPRLGDAPGVARIVKAGNLLFIMGQAPVDETRVNVVGKGDMKAQAMRCFEKMKIALEDAGASMDDLVELNIYVTDMSRMSEVAEAQKKYIPKGDVASMAVEVNSMVSPDFMVEITGVAVAP